MVYRFLHLSDIHFGQEKNGTRIYHEAVRRSLITDASEMARTRGVAHYLLVTGDIAFGGKPEEFARAGQWLDKLTAAAGCPDTHVRVIPGNHDCDRAKVQTTCKMVHDAIRACTPKEIQGHLEGVAQDSEAMNPLLPKLLAYRDFASSYGCDFQSVARPVWEEDLAMRGGVTLRLLGLNSVQVCDEQDRPGDMVLGSQQYALPEAANTVYVVLIHHPLNWFKDQIEATNFIHNRARVIMVGHEHVLDISKTTDVRARERLEIYSGAVNPPDVGDVYRYTYNWLEFSVGEQNGEARLILEVFPRVWVPERTRIEADIGRLGGPSSATISIACPDIALNSSLATVLKPAVPSRGGTKTGVAPVSGSATAMAATDDEAFAKLRLLFWRHLSWQQRLAVLVKVNALPQTADRPLPQTLEKLALETARDNGKLFDLWAAMTPLLPEDKREPNPFASS